MTSAASATSIHKKTGRHVRASGFTLIELLVVIGIILIVAALAIPMLMKAYRAGDRAKTAADFTSITVALEAFKQDWGDYPRPDSPGQNAGFATLGRYLIGPGGKGGATAPPAYNSARVPPYGVGDVAPSGSEEYVWTDIAKTPASGPPSSPWVQFSYSDGYDGPGMKKAIGNKVYGPYLQPDKFKTRGLALLDRQGVPILYFPANPGKPNIHTPVGTVGSYIDVSDKSLYNAGDNLTFFAVATEATPYTNARRAIQMMLGDTKTIDGTIGAGETEPTTGPFLLWSAGPDGLFGPIRSPNNDPTSQSIIKCDDVTNFR